MKKGDVTCSKCGAGFRRLELPFGEGTNGDYCCPACSTVLEVFDGSVLVIYRLTIPPSTRRIRD
jgi:hypothetical protein